MGRFVSADIGAMERFFSRGAELVTEFNSIKSEFESTHRTLNAVWNGYAGEAYQNFSDDVLENIGDLGTVLQSINESIQGVIDAYNNMDEELAAYNRNPTGE